METEGYSATTSVLNIVKLIPMVSKWWVPMPSELRKIYECIYQSVGMHTVPNKSSLGSTVNRLVNTHDKNAFFSTNFGMRLNR